MATRPFQFTRKLRLTRPAEFQRVFAQARRSADRYFTLLYSDNQHQTPRLGFAIAKKKVARAVHRNRLKRIARESFRQQSQTLGAIDIIILAQPAAAHANNKELSASLDRHWRKLAERQDDGRGQRRSRGKKKP